MFSLDELRYLEFHQFDSIGCYVKVTVKETCDRRTIILPQMGRRIPLTQAGSVTPEMAEIVAGREICASRSL